MKHLRLILAALLCAQISACAWFTAPPPGKPIFWVPLPETARLADSVALRWRQIQGFSAMAKAKYTEPEHETIFSEELLIRNPCSFRLTVLGLFDRPQAYIASNCRDLSLHDVANKRFFQGPVESGVTLDRFPLPLKGDEVVAALLGHPWGFPELVTDDKITVPVEDPQQRGWRFDTKPPAAASLQAGGAPAGDGSAAVVLTDSYWFDSETHLPARWSRSSPDGETLAVEWEEWTGENLKVPKIVKLFIPARALMLELTYSEADLNPPPSEERLFTLDPPRGIPVEQLGAPVPAK